jgi:hypothetical protein
MKKLIHKSMNLGLLVCGVLFMGLCVWDGMNKDHLILGLLCLLLAKD